MVRYALMRHVESTDKWVMCGGTGGSFLVQKALLDRPKVKNQQNLLKLEMYVTMAALVQEGDSL